MFINLSKRFRPWSVLLHLKSVPVSKLFIPLPKRFVSFSRVLLRPQSVPFRSQSVSFRTNRSNRFMQSVLKSSGVFIVIIKMVNWDWIWKLTPFIWRINLLFHISGLILWNCFDLQVKLWIWITFTIQSIGCSASW